MLGRSFGEELPFQRQVGNWADVSDDTQRAERHNMQRQVNYHFWLNTKIITKNVSSTVNALVQNFPLYGIYMA